MSATTGSYLMPQMRLFHDVEEIYSGLVGSLQAVIIGPHFDVKKYVANAVDNNYDLYAGEYVGGQETRMLWPSRPAGGIVDLDEVTVRIDAARVKYWDGTAAAATTRLVNGTRTHIRSSSINWQAYETYDRSPLLPARDVQLEDGVRIRVPAAGVDLSTRVVGFAHEIEPSAVEALVVDTNNKTASPVSATPSLYYSIGTPPTITADASGYTGLTDGVLSENFTVTVVTSATGSDNDTAVLSVTSDAGFSLNNVSPATGTISGIRGIELMVGTDGTLEAGQTWRVVAAAAFTPPTITSGGEYAGLLDTTYLIQVVSSGIVGSATRAPTVSVTTDNGIDQERTNKILVAGELTVGNYGATMTVADGDMFYAGDQFRIKVIATKNGAVSTLIVAHSLPETVDDTMAVQVDLYLDRSITVDEIKRNQAPYRNYETSLSALTLSPEVTYYVDEMVDAAGEPIRMVVESGRVYIEYRSLLQEFANATHELPQTSSDGSTTLVNIQNSLGYFGPENPLAYGAYFASLNSGGTSVIYIAVKSNDLAGYAAALGRLDARTGTYGLVPLTTDPEILSYVQSFIATSSSPENCRWRKGWFSREFQELETIVAGTETNPTMMQVVSRVEDEGAFLTVEMVGGAFLTQGVRPGDALRFGYMSDGYGGYTYDTYTVDHVLSEDSLKLMSGPDRVYDVPLRAEIWRTRTASEFADVYGRYAGAYNDKRINLIWPPEVTVNGQKRPGYYLCAALAGLKSGVLPHQGLTNVTVNGFDDMELTTDYLETADLDRMAFLGVWIVTRDLYSGQIYTRQQLTTAGYGNIKLREDSVVSNWDAISYRLRNLYVEYIGKTNLTPEFVEWFRPMVENDLRNIRSDTMGNILLGPQIVSWEILSFEISSTVPDALECRVRFTGPHPFNNFDMYMIF